MTATSHFHRASTTSMSLPSGRRIWTTPPSGTIDAVSSHERQDALGAKAFGSS